MRRVTIPADESLFKDFNEKVPYGIRAALIRGLMRVAMASPTGVLHNIAFNEKRPELFEIKER